MSCWYELLCHLFDTSCILPSCPHPLPLKLSIQPDRTGRPITAYCRDMVCTELLTAKTFGENMPGDWTVHWVCLGKMVFLNSALLLMFGLVPEICELAIMRGLNERAQSCTNLMSNKWRVQNLKNAPNQSSHCTCCKLSCFHRPCWRGGEVQLMLSSGKWDVGVVLGHSLIRNRNRSYLSNQPCIICNSQPTTVSPMATLAFVFWWDYMYHIILLKSVCEVWSLIFKCKVMIVYEETGTTRVSVTGT